MVTICTDDWNYFGLRNLSRANGFGKQYFESRDFMSIAVMMFMLLTVGSRDQVEDLIKQAASEDVSERLEAVLELGQWLPKLPDEFQSQVAEAIVNALADDSEDVRAAAGMRIAENSAIINMNLQPFLNSQEPLPFTKACEAIKAIGPEARIWLPLIEKKLDLNERIYKLAALHALRVLDGKDLLPLLEKIIQALDHPDFNVQLSACRVIVQIGPDAKKAGPHLVKLLENGIASSRSWASIALGAVGPHEDYDVVDLLVERLSRFYLVDRQRALEGLALLGPEAKLALPQVEALMNDPTKSVQHTAARTHWKISGSSELAVKTLIPLISTMEHGVESMDILAEMGPQAQDSMEALIIQLKSSELPMREAAVYALAAIGPNAAAAVGPLRELQRDPDLLIRAAAENAIKKIEQVAPQQ